MDALIRPARPTDASAIARVQWASWLAAYDAIVPSAVLAAQSVQKQETFWQRALERRTDNVLVAVDASDDVMAWVSFGRLRKEPEADDQGEIYAIYARPDYFRSGIGRRLWNRVKPLSRSEGFRVVYARVLRDNHPARAFYERVGFALLAESESTFSWEGVQIADVCYAYRFDSEH